MQNYKMTVHEALAELKVLSDRIEKLIREGVFVSTNKHANTKINGITVDEYAETMKSSLQKVEDLIARRSAIKRAVTDSNAKTVVTLTKDNGEVVSMTVAQLIEYKNVGISYLEDLCNTLSRQYNLAQVTAKRTNDDLDAKADQYVCSLYGGKDTVDKSTANQTRASYIEANTVDIIDPNKLLKKIESLKDEIDFYRSKVDAALSTSNALTVIEFEV